MTSIADNPANNRFNLRALLAGGTATTSLIAATVLALLSLAVYVSFEDLPLGGDAAAGDAISLGPPIAGAPENAAAGAPGVAGAVAAAPTVAVAAVPAPGVTAAGAGPSAVAPPSGGDLAAPTIVTGTGVVGTPPGGAPVIEGESGVLGGTLNNLQTTTDLPLSEVTNDLTAPLDQGVNDALNDIGGAIGNPQLGDRLSAGVDRLGDQVLGPEGPVDQLLP